MYNLIKKIIGEYRETAIKNNIRNFHRKDKELRQYKIDLKYVECNGQLKREIDKYLLETEKELSKNTKEFISYCENITTNESLSLNIRVFAQYTLGII